MIKQYLKHRRVCRNIGIKPFNPVEYVIVKYRERLELDDFYD